MFWYILCFHAGFGMALGLAFCAARENRDLRPWQCMLTVVTLTALWLPVVNVLMVHEVCKVWLNNRAERRAG